jgi:hypothetical protein
MSSNQRICGQLEEFQQAAFQQEPTYRVRGILTDGFDSTTKSMRTLFPGARLGNSYGQKTHAASYV